MGYDAEGIYFLEESDDEGTASTTINLIPASVSDQFVIDRAAIDALEAGAARGGLADYLVAAPANLDAIATATLGDTAWMTTPGTGIDPLRWRAYAGAGGTIDWQPEGLIHAATKANLDTFIAAIALITDTRFEVGGLAYAADTRGTYKFTSAAGALELVQGWVPIIPTTVSVGATVNPAPVSALDGEITAAGSLTQLDVTIPNVAIYKKIRATLRMASATSGTLTMKLLNGASPEATASSYRGYQVVGATGGALTPGTSWAVGVGRVRRAHEYLIYSLGATRATLITQLPSVESDAAANELLISSGLNHNVASALTGLRLDLAGAGALSDFSFTLEGYL